MPRSKPRKVVWKADELESWTPEVAEAARVAAPELLQAVRVLSAEVEEWIRWRLEMEENEPLGKHKSRGLRLAEKALALVETWRKRGLR